MKIYGQELWADVAAPAAVLSDESAIRECLVAGASAIGSVVLSSHHQRFEPSGVTAIAIIGESHLLASTYEELGIVAINIQTCTRNMDLVLALTAICRSLRADEVRSLMIVRRLDVPVRIELERTRVPFRDGRLVMEPQPAFLEERRLAHS